MARKFGWLAGASYVNLRNIRGIERPIGLIDIDWKNYDFKRHLETVKEYKPLVTVAHDVVRIKDLDRILDQAYELLEWCDSVVVVPKDRRLGADLSEIIPREFVLGYSVPTRYGGTHIPLHHFKGRSVHLLGGRPDVQRKTADELDVVSLDVNRFTLDAEYGDFFDGEKFKPHPIGGYHRCLEDSIRNIEALWVSYHRHQDERRMDNKEGDTTRPTANKEASRREF